MKGAKVVHISYKFHLHQICNSIVFKFQIFSIAVESMRFQTAFERFLAVTPPAEVKFVWKFDQWYTEQGSASDMPRFLLYYWEMVRIEPKNLFSGSFWEVLCLRSYALWVTPQICVKIKVLWSYIIVLSFISKAFVVAKL